MRKVYGANASPFVRKVRLALEEKGLDYELEQIMPFGVSDEYKKISPLGKIPTYEEGDWTIPDSSVILDYLDRTTEGPALYPSDPKQRAQAAFLEEYCDGALIPNGVGTVFFQRIVNPLFLGGTTDQAAVDQALTETIPPMFDYLQSQLDNGSDFLVGDALSVADLAVGSALVNFRHAGESVDPQRWPRLAAYVDKLFARPAFKKLIDEETAQFAPAS